MINDCEHIYLNKIEIEVTTKMNGIVETAKHRNMFYENNHKIPDDRVKTATNNIVI